MGQNQPRNPESLPTEGKGRGGISEPLKDKVGAKFQDRMKVNPATGTGSKGNPGRPV
jgi:hypothetical protein